MESKEQSPHRQEFGEKRVWVKWGEVFAAVGIKTFSSMQNLKLLRDILNKSWLRVLFRSSITGISGKYCNTWLLAVNDHCLVPESMGKGSQFRFLQFSLFALGSSLSTCLLLRYRRAAVCMACRSNAGLGEGESGVRSHIISLGDQLGNAQISA